MAAASSRRGASVQLDEHDLLHIDWVQEVPEDLDVFIAQREFEAAVDLVEKSTYALNMHSHASLN